MSLPPLLNLKDSSAYRDYYLKNYCNKRIFTFDGIPVKFFPEKFEHAFYRDSARGVHDKANFNIDRAKRMDWIKAVLSDRKAELYLRQMSESTMRRIAIVPTSGYPYAVIIHFDRLNSPVAKFWTA